MIKTIHIEDGGLYLSKRYLKDFTSVKTIEYWNGIKDISKINIDSEIFFLYKSIPFRTRKKLPSPDKIISQETKTGVRYRLAESLHDAYYFKHTKYKSFYENSTLTRAQITKFCQLHSTFQTIIDLKKNEGFKDLQILFNVFNNLFPGKYKSKNALSNAIRQAACNGIMSVAMDKRVFGNNNEQSNNKISPVTKYWLACLAAHSRKFSNPKILELITKACEEKSYTPPSLSWVKQNRKKILRNVIAYDSRYGQSELNKKMPFASLNHATYSNDQWQMDGWKLPFWSKGEKYLQRYIVVRLIDSKSKKIVGFSVGKSENSSLIMEAIIDAIRQTGVLPFEILTDNHAFNQTQEAKHLQALLMKKGTQWTVTQNPQHKAIVERYNNHLDTLCKDYYGYLGQGIRSKSIEALAKPEMIDQYIKNLVPENEINARVISIVESYNKSVRSNGKSFNDLFVENANPNPIIVSLFDRAELCTKQTVKLIRRGQITFKTGVTKYEFQLPAALFQIHNDTTVKVHYEDLREGIYLFHKETGEPIDYIEPKDKINGAKVNQTDSDIHLLNKHKGRIVGIKTKASKQLETLTERALEIDPDAYERMNALTTPKNVKQEMEENSSLRRIAEAKGLNMETLHVPERFNPGVATALQPKRKEQNPFSAKGNKIEIIDIKKILNDD
jgi:transposase InsO family protein